jgi:hypothetical protein
VVIDDLLKKIGNPNIASHYGIDYSKQGLFLNKIHGNYSFQRKPIKNYKDEPH